MENLQSSLFAAGVLVLVGALVLLFMYFFRREFLGRSRSLQQSRDDLSNMMILLQTMRDLLDQQKQLARQLNASLDKKVSFIRESVDTAMKDVAELRAEIHQAATLAKHSHRSSQEAGAERPNGHDLDTPAAPKKVPHLTVVENSAAEGMEERPPLQLLALPKEPPAHDDVIESWVGLDFGGDEPDPLAFDVPDVPPEEPQDAEAAREAFRALLNLNENPQSEPRQADRPAAAGTRSGGNGKAVPPLHASVYEYNDAGMTVAQIAHEIGIGKGEVRLILSLRKNRSD